MWAGGETESFPVNLIVDYLGVEDRLKKLTEEIQIRGRPAAEIEYYSPRSATRVRIGRELTALSVIEIALQTPYFYFDYENPPINPVLFRSFVRKSLPFLSGLPFINSAFFMLRYIDINLSTELPIGSRRTAELSYGQVSGFVELTDHFVSSQCIYEFVSDLDREFDYRSIRHLLVKLFRRSGSFINSRKKGEKEFKEIHDNLRRILYVEEFERDYDDKETDRKLTETAADCFGYWFRPLSGPALPSEYLLLYPRSISPDLLSKIAEWALTTGSASRS